MTEETKRKLIRIGCPTGSHYFGCAGNDSDYDYFVKNKTFLRLSGFGEVNDDGCKAVRYDSEEQIYAIEYELDGKRINIIILKPEYYEIWIRATSDMRNLCGLDSFKSMIGDKDLRIQIFQELKSYHKMVEDVPF